jgi:hypothetical protein
MSLTTPTISMLVTASAVAGADAITDRTAVVEVSASEAFVDDRRSLAG